MLDQETRSVILKLRRAGHGVRKISRALQVSRNSVRRVLKSQSREVPPLKRAEKLSSHLEIIRELHADCQGNLVRVQEELAAREGVMTSYSTLTGFCRRHKIGVKPKQPAGRYHFGPGVEMQHDTSPHDVEVGGRVRRLQCASLVLCYSRMIYAQAYPTFNRFYCKIFLTEALCFFGGAADRCMLDNSTVVIAHGTGKDAVPAPEMAAFSDRFNFHFEAHEIGDANRSGRVERPFHYIEHNFYPGRRFEDLAELNRQLRTWCEQKNASFKRKLHAKPIELFQAERPHLKPLPIHVPEVYRLHERIVDVEGYVALHTNRYSVPFQEIGRRVEVRESRDHVRIYLGHRLLSEHARREEGRGKRVTSPEHRDGVRWKRNRERPPLPDELALRAAGAELASLVDRLKSRHGGRAVRALRRLHRMYLEYPSEPLRQACASALEYGLLDLKRIEQMTLHNIAGDFFRLPRGPIGGDDDG